MQQKDDAWLNILCNVEPMGLTVQFNLSLPGATSQDDALRLIAELHDVAQRQKPVTLSPIVQLSHRESADDHAPLSLRGTIALIEEIMHNGYNLGADAADANALSSVAFAMTPGERCESAFIGLTAPIASAVRINAEIPVPIHDWHWTGFCKTQYASNISGDYFVQSHKKLIHVLDEARRLGLTVDVHDEGGYWESRSDARLIAQVAHASACTQSLLM